MSKKFFLFLSPLAVNCNHILCVRGASLICEEYLLSSDKSIGFLSVEILWNLLENGSQIMVHTHTCTCTCMCIVFFNNTFNYMYM